MSIFDNPDIQVIGTADEAGLSYEFSTFLVVQKDRTYYWASDSGCSCPSPFEDHQFPDDFESGNAVQALNALTQWSKGMQVENDGLRTRLMSG